jgi:hypothetical protein
MVHPIESFDSVFTKYITCYDLFKEVCKHRDAVAPEKWMHRRILGQRHHGVLLSAYILALTADPTRWAVPMSA